MKPSSSNSFDGPSASLYASAPYGSTLYGVRVMSIGYVRDVSFGTYAVVNNRTPSRIGTRNSNLV
jgi:hypothetical protein